MEKYLIHHGIKGQKWGIRRYQNKDGTLTEAGRKRLYSEKLEYLNPRYNTRTNNYKGSENRYEVYKQYRKEIENVNINDEKYGRIVNSYLDKYSEATLKDIRLKPSLDAKKELKRIFDKDLYYKYELSDEKGNEIDTRYERGSYQNEIDRWSHVNEWINGSNKQEEKTIRRKKL